MNDDGMLQAKENRMDDHPDNWGFKPAGDTRPTPETDAMWEEACCSGNSWYRIAEDMMKMCRRLERERDSAYRTIQYLQKKYGT